MKNIKYLLGLVTVVIVMASCATTQGAMDDGYYDGRTRPVGNRVYVEDPYAGTVVLERDPYTGRYYDVTSGPRYGGLYSPYGSGYRNRVYSNNRRGSYRGGTIVQPQRPSQPVIKQNREEVRKKVLGN